MDRPATEPIVGDDVVGAGRQAGAVLSVTEDDLGVTGVVDPGDIHAIG